MEKKEIQICPICKGVGHVEESELDDYHHRTRNYWDETCRKCNGSGRILVTTITTEESYTPPERRQKDVH